MPVAPVGMDGWLIVPDYAVVRLMSAIIELIKLNQKELAPGHSDLEPAIEGLAAVEPGPDGSPACSLPLGAQGCSRLLDAQGGVQVRAD